MIRVAAVGDVHYGRHTNERMRSHFEALADKADLFLIAGDLTQSGSVEEARAFAADLGAVKVPIVSVLGNHDYHADEQEGIKQALTEAGVTVLEGNTAQLKIRDRTVGIIGMKGFGGGFGGACCTEFGEVEMKAFARHSRHQAEVLQAGLQTLNTDYRFVLLHYSPVDTTLLGERREIYPFLGSYLLGEAVDEIGATCIFHGHAHLGTERGATSGGIPVRNVAMTVIRHAYNIYTFEQTARREETRRAEMTAGV